MLKKASNKTKHKIQSTFSMEIFVQDIENEHILKINSIGIYTK